MAITTLTLKNESRRGKWGKVFAIDGSATEYKITEAELAALHASANGIPPGLTRAQWESGAYAVSAHDFDIGDVVKESDGSVVFKYHEKIVAGKIVESFAKVPAADWTGTFPNITVARASLAAFPGNLSVAGGVASAVASVDTSVI